MRKLACVLVVAALAAGGCAGRRGYDPGDYVRPSIAVMKFENRAPFPLGWNLSDGMKDVLVDELMRTRRFHVMERPELGSVMQELRFQNSGVTREQNRAALGRLKNVQYLVKGTITDFGHVSRGDGFASGAGWSIFGGRTRAVMGLTMYVVDVESGEIICSESIEESVRAKDIAVQAQYSNVGFGGSTFNRTPLGRATAKVIGRAVQRITYTIASQPWQPKLAMIVSEDEVVINGGADRRVQVGAEFDVVTGGPAIVDPDTGDAIGAVPGRAVGRVRVWLVEPRYSVAVVVAGATKDLTIGQRCEPAPTVAAR